MINAETIISEYGKLVKDEILNLEYKNKERVEITKTSLKFGRSGLFFITGLEIIDGRLYAVRNDYLLGQIKTNGIIEFYNSIPAVGLAECGLAIKEEI